MPVYEYACGSCNQVTEARQRMSDPKLTDCPLCEGGKLRRILSVINIGAQASGAKPAACDVPQLPSCHGCGKAGTGCS